MEDFKQLFKNSRLGLGLIVGIFLGVIIGGGTWDWGVAAALTVSFIIIVAENMLLRTKE